jgi:hypothetical protein
MKLTDLSPRWIYKNKMFTFLCPHCRKTWLTCKRVAMNDRQQWDIFHEAFSCDTGDAAWPVGCKEDVAWKFSGFDFATMSVTPSLDASKSGHWHGHITNGQIVGGIQA